MTTRKYFDEELEELHDLLTEMCSLTEEMIGESVRALKLLDRDLGASVAEADKRVDELEMEIEKKCMRILLKQQPVANDLIKVTTALKVITDIERIGDQAADIGEIVRQFPTPSFAKDLRKIERMGDLAVVMIHQSVDAFLRENTSGADMVIRADDEMDELFLSAKAELTSVIAKDVNAADEAVSLLMIVKYLEKIGDYAVNVSEWTKYLVTGVHKEYQ